MSDHVQHTIRILEQELEATQQQCAELERALIPLRRLAGQSPGPARSVKATPKKAQKRNERTNEQSARQRGRRIGAALTMTRCLRSSSSTDR